MDESPGRFPPPPDASPPAFPSPPEETPQRFPPSQPYGYPYGPSRPYPLNLSRILELTFSIFRFRWQTFVGIALLIMIPAWIVLSATTVILFSSDDWYSEIANMFRTGVFDNPLPRIWPALLANLVISLLVGVVSYITTGALTSAADQTYASEATSVSSSFRRSLGRLRTLVGVLLVTFAITNLIVFGAVLAGLALFLATATGGQIQPGPLVFLGLVVFVAAFVALVFIGIRFALAVPVVILEQVGPIDALRRSWRLVSGSGWRVLGYLFVFGLIVGVTGGLLSGVINVAINPVRVTGLTTVSVDPVKLAITTLIQGLIRSVFEAIPVIGTLLLYYDLRWRHGEPVPQPGSRTPAPPMVPPPAG
jgi:hypothetical protein